MIGAFRIYICAAAVYVMLASLLVLFGWMVNNEQLISLFPAMNGKVLPFLGQLHSSAAICLFLLSVAFLLSIPASDWCRRISAAICSFVFVSSLPAIYVAITRDDFEPIRIMQPDPAASGITFPVPMAVEVAASMILLSISILFLCLPFKNSVKISQMISVSAMAIPLLIILGAATRVPQICALGGCFTMSTGFALLCLALSSAIFLVRPDLEFAALFSARTMGGALLRRVIMFCFIVPFLLIARTVAVHSQIDIDEQTAWLVFIFLILLSMVALVVSGVKAVDQMEHERTRIASELKDALDKQQEIAGALKQTKEQLELSRRSGNNSGSSSGNSTTKYKMVCLECAQEFDEPQQTCPVDGSKLSRVIDDSLIGTVFLDKYVVKELIGSGGMSTVYRATHLYVDRDVAIKFLKEKALLHPANLKRFMREGRATGRLDHPGIVGVSDVGLAPNGHAFLIMDYLEGMSLSQWLDIKGCLRMEEFNDIMGQVCDAVAFAHEHGVIHRDLKPSNIMLVKASDGSQRVKIVDFGLARVVGEESDPLLKLTMTGECFGSPLYMSPEQCFGKKVDERSDVYALGCIFFECLTGTPPIIGTNVQDTLRKHREEGPASFPEGTPVPLHIQGAIYKALQKEARARQKSVRQLKRELLFDTHAAAV